MTVGLQEAPTLPNTLTPASLRASDIQLKIADRCDRCGAQAFMVFTNGTQMFLFCGHHGNKHKDALVAQGFNDIADHRHLINKSASESSA